ncbi:MAG: Antidote-toxin recognition MazE, bacterial antitoxin [Thermomicrobiales bacterium]|nr:Antidote-toxin recognition MazE, bacterial antitoxin [Thermomicrobiales bacterium]
MGVLTSVSPEGQVTLPKSVRDELRLEPFDRIEIRVIDGEARLRKVDLTLADLEGIFPALDRDIDPDEAIRIAKEERAALARVG